MNSDLAPIILFVYNRPEHTRRTLQSLLNNELADKSDLFVYCDGPKSLVDLDAVEKVRNYVKEIVGFSSVEIIERSENFGLAHSIIEGVTDIVNRFGRVIVLEDDVVTSQCFLRYINDALRKYQFAEKVMHISGYMFPIDSDGLPETFFYRSTSCWGWGTWDRAWQFFDKDPGRLLDQFTQEDIHRFDLGGVAGHWEQVMSNAKGRDDTWAVFWYATVFQQGGLCLHPSISMTMNIGHDGSGTHSRREKNFNVALASAPVQEFPNDYSENTEAVKRLASWYADRRGSFMERFVQKLMNIWC